jgi:hypothetical protein
LLLLLVLLIVLLLVLPDVARLPALALSHSPLHSGRRSPGLQPPAGALRAPAGADAALAGRLSRGQLLQRQLLPRGGLGWGAMQVCIGPACRAFFA